MRRSYLKSFVTGLLLLSVCAIALALRWPLVNANNHYFRDEDDSRQFNRAVEMAKDGDLNPRYFNKPSLDFYLRIPVVLGSYTFAKSKGEIKDINEIKTRDPFGLSGWSFAVSHPTILQWNRIFSICLSVGVVAFAFIIAMQLRRGPVYASLAALITATSPEVLKNSYLVGVDVLMAFLCLACTAVGIHCVSKTSRATLVACGILAGLAGAAKYNALPIVLVPLSVWALKERTRYGLFLTLTSPGVGFFLGCPYSLLSFPEFGQAVVYEAWHYSVAGHAGHSAEPGLEQAIFYFGWLIAEGVGVAAGGLALASSVYFVKQRNFEIAVFLAFPIAYSLLMISQKTNFTNNMVVMVPYVAIMAVCGLARLAKVAEHESVKKGAPPALASLALIQLTIPCIAYIRAQKRVDSRDIASSWIAQERHADEDVVVSGPLQLSPMTLKQSGVDVFTPSEKTSASLIQEGYTYVVMSPLSTVASDRELLSVAKEIPGVLYQQKIPDSPAIQVYRLNTDRVDIAAKRAPSSLVLAALDAGNPPTCAADGETFCWLAARRTNITLQDKASEPRRVKLPVMTPWANQEVVITTPQGTQLYSGTIKDTSVWMDITFTLPANIESISVTLRRVHSQGVQRSGKNLPRVGLGVKAPSFEIASSSEGDQQRASIISAYPEQIRVSIVETLTQEIEAPAEPAPAPAAAHPAATEAPETPGNIYALLQTLDSEVEEGSAPQGSGTQPESQVIEIPKVQEKAEIAQQQGEFRKKFLDTILAATAEGT